MRKRVYILGLALVAACQVSGDRFITLDAGPPVGCGNGVLDEGEICDDGNTSDGDGCSADCRSNERCGNGIVDVHARIAEQCDDGNTIDGDGCSAKCTVEVCGNGIIDLGEICDDGNTSAGDGCSADCRSTEVCGNGIVDRAVGEVCDPPDPGRCSADCRSTLTCGNGVTDPGEECDNGPNNRNNLDCRSDCVINRCGDGYLDQDFGHPEQCDDAPQAPQGSRTVIPTETARCNLDCTAARCGDGKINGHYIPPGAGTPEQCDNGTTNSDSAVCTASCHINVCGDGHVLAGTEVCDDGNTRDGDGCSANCLSTEVCGNGIVDGAVGEVCDDGNLSCGSCAPDCRHPATGHDCPSGQPCTSGNDCESGVCKSTHICQ